MQKLPVEVTNTEGFKVIIKEAPNGKVQILPEYNKIKVDIRHYEFDKKFLQLLREGINEFLNQ